MSIEYGVRDQKVLSWNGRLSEIVAAVMLEQLRAYPKHLKQVQENVGFFKDNIKNIEGVEFINEENILSAYTQVIMKIDKNKLGISKPDLMKKLAAEGVMAWHGSFELLNQLSFFKQGEWKKWVFNNDLQRVEQNYLGNFTQAKRNYEETSLGFYKTHFLTKSSTKNLINKIKKVL
jgi:dTDP-4-amino-4,6-dideoxygalactose transaminase